MTEKDIRVWKIESFWRGYEWALAGRLPRFENDWILAGWAQGHIEREGWFRVSKWEGRRKRFRRLLFWLTNEAKRLLGLKHRKFDLKTWQGIPVR